MMEVKGAGITYMPKMIKEKFGEDAYQKWLTSLPEESQKIFQGQILASLWYSLKYGGLITENKILELFYNNDISKAWEIGRYAADDTLSGIYRAFVRLGNPSYIISKAGSIMATFFKPAKIVTAEKEKNRVVLRIVEFAEITEMLELHIGGWMERALEICGCQNIQVKINTHLSRGAPYTEYEATWA
ncbi:hypothetical protein ACFLZ9_00495 [Patescibacteria group bacterium]